MNNTQIPSPVAVPDFDCEQTVRRLWDYLDGELGALDLAKVDAHLAECDRCPPHFAFERRFLDAVRAARTATLTPAPDKTRALRGRVLAMLAADGAQGRSGETHE